MAYSEHQYRSLPRYSNSDLSELDSYLFGKKPFTVSAETLLFGTAFHTIVLEPELFNQTQLRQTDEAMTTLQNMKRAVFADKELVTSLYHSDKEIVRLWDCPVTGLLLKGKLDAVVRPKQQHIIDLKSTSCRTKPAFVDSLLTYNYDRQAAFYLSSDEKARFFEFVGVQKQPPYKVFRVPFFCQDGFILEGERKMYRLLRTAKQEAEKKDGWRPKSWGTAGTD